MPPPPPQHYETQQLHRRNSVPAMRASLPPIVGDRSSIYGRSAAVHEDYRREQPEELLGKRNKLQPPQSRYEHIALGSGLVQLFKQFHLQLSAADQ